MTIRMSDIESSFVKKNDELIKYNLHVPAV